MNICIGLFGTCDNVRWRDPFMKKYDELGIEYFNPMVDNWHPGMVPLEARHLAEDDIILFSILKDSYGQGSLSEVGFGPLRAMRQNKNRSFVIIIDDDVKDELKVNADRAKDSKHARALVRGHILEIKAPNVFLVDSLDQMLETSLNLHRVHLELDKLHSVSA